MHCLPADKGQEVSQDIFEDKDALRYKRLRIECMYKNLFLDGAWVYFDTL